LWHPAKRNKLARSIPASDSLKTRNRFMPHKIGMCPPNFNLRLKRRENPTPWVRLKPRVKQSKRGSVSFSPPKRGEGRDEGIRLTSMGVIVHIKMAIAKLTHTFSHTPTPCLIGCSMFNVQCWVIKILPTAKRTC
jgi:hypothetical protein